MATVKLRFRPSAITGKKGTLYYQVIHRRKVAVVSTAYHISQDEWDTENNTIRLGDKTNRSGRTALLRLYRSETDRMINRMRAVIFEHDTTQCDYTITDLLTAFHGIASDTSVFRYIRKQIAKKTDMQCYGTAKTYTSALRSFEKFCCGNDLCFDDMTAATIEAYEAWMLHAGLQRSSASCYIRTLRTLYRQAANDGLTSDTDIFKRVHLSIGKTRKRAVSADVIRAIMCLDLSGKPSLDFARDIFMFSFYTRGMSFVDIAHLKKNNLRNGFITYSRRKTFQTLTIQWEHSMQTIVDRYEKQTINSPYMFPIIRGETPSDRTCYEQTLQRVNRSLKRIGTMIGLVVPLSTYVARHSWASIARNMDVPLSVISEGLGHDSDKTTQIYLASLDTSMINQANRKIINRITLKGNV